MESSLRWKALARLALPPDRIFASSKKTTAHALLQRVGLLLHCPSLAPLLRLQVKLAVSPKQIHSLQ
jgi:hypothetical protein